MASNIGYELRRTNNGFRQTVWDTANGTGVWQIDLELQLAHELTDALDRLDAHTPTTAIAS